MKDRFSHVDAGNAGRQSGLRLAALACAGACALHAVAQPAPVPASVAQVESLDRFQAEQERLRRLMESRPPAYEDKVMDPSALPPARDDTSPVPEEEQGLRSFVSESRAGVARGSGDGIALRKATELGQRLAYQRETLNYGSYTLELDVRRSSDPLGLNAGLVATEKDSARITLRSIGLPISPQTFADTSLGDIYSELTTALGRTYRLSLGSSTVRGASTRIFDGRSDTRAGVGLRGVLAGGPYPGFERVGGELAWLGHSRRIGESGFAGVQLARATDVPVFNLTATAGAARVSDVSSIAASAGVGSEQLADGGMRGRAVYVRSSTSDALPAAQGLFLEGAVRLGDYRHELGLYRADPNLRYGDSLLTSDNQGAYWRVDVSGPRLNWGLGFDVEQQNPEGEPGRTPLRSLSGSANVQYRIDRHRSFGANVSVRRARYETTGDTAALGDGVRTLYASGYYQTRLQPGWGATRLRASVRRNQLLVANDLPATGEEVEWEQDWITGRFETMRPELTTTLGIARDRSAGVTETSPTAGVGFRVWVDPTWWFSGNLRFVSRQSNLSTNRGLSGTMDTERTIGHGWTAGASVSLNQAVVDVGATTVNGPVVTRSNDKSASVFLRWEGVGGAPYQGPGVGMPGAVGAGSVGGVVYMDANRDGDRQLGETGVPNVEVVLDGRYRALTDRNGRFDFPLVGTGRHQLTLTLESVPLPWGAASNRPLEIDVPLRGQATTHIPVIRIGD